MAALTLLFFCAAFTLHTPSPTASAANTDLNVTVAPSLSLVVDNGSGGTNISLSSASAPSGSLLKANLSVRAGSNNPTGYTLTFSDEDADNNLVEENDSALTIPALSAPVAEASFPSDRWGYSLDGADYAAVPLLSAPLTIDQTDAPGDSTHTVSFATKISNDTPGGTYKDSMVFSLVANYVPPAVTFFPSITKMQEMTSSICNAVSTPAVAATTIVTTENAYTDPDTQVPQTTLQDTRDNKYYIIRKLADGNCWMAQNLDIELAGKTFTNQDTDLNSKTSWTGAIVVNVGNTWSQSDYTTARYYSASNTQTGDTYWTNGGTNMTVNPDQQTTWSGSFPNNPNPTPAYLMGNYYTWPAATAGSVDSSYSSTSKEAPDSICPKGWRLPLNEGNKSWYNLLTTTYGITNDATGSEKVLKDPLTFVRSGHYGYLNGQLVAQGTGGGWWSAVASPFSAGGAQYFVTTQGYVGPQGADNVSGAWSVRCVAR